MRLLLVIALLVNSINCGAFANELIRLAVPPGFEGPTSMSPGPGAHADGYLRKIPGAERGTLIQVSNIGTVVITFHTQGFADSPIQDRTDALRAIEAVTFAGG